MRFGANYFDIRTVQRLYRYFRTDNMNLKNQYRRRPSSVVDNNHLKDLLEKDTCSTVRELAPEMNVI